MVRPDCQLQETGNPGRSTYARGLYTQRRQGHILLERAVGLYELGVLRFRRGAILDFREELIMLRQRLLGLFFLRRAQRGVHLQGGL